MFRWLVEAVLAVFKSRAQLIAENLCLRQQLVVLKRRQKRPRLCDYVFFIIDHGTREIIHA